MSLQVPTTAQIRESIIAGFESRLPTTVLRLSHKFLYVFATVLSGVVSLNYKYGGFIFLQQFVQFASTEETDINGRKVIPLVQWGRRVGVPDRTLATRFEGAVSIAVTDQTGTLPANTLLASEGTGYTYLTLAAVPLTSASVTAPIRAVDDPDKNGGRGAAGNLITGDTLSFLGSPSNVSTDVVLSSVTTTAADEESWDAYRQRILDRFRSQPQGGAPADYESWAESVEGIINAYPYTGDPGQVNVYCEATEKSSGDPDGIPTVAQLTAVANAIEYNDNGLASRRPISSFVNVYGISRTKFEVVVSGLVTDDPTLLPVCKTQIDAAIESYLLSREPYINGLSAGTRRDRVSQFDVFGIIQDVASAYSGVFSAASITPSGGSSFILYPLGEGEKAGLDSVTYV